MNFNTFGLSAVIAATAITVSVYNITPAYAAKLTGVLNIAGSVVTNSATQPTNLNFVDGNGSASGEFDIGFSSLGFDNTPGTIGGAGTIGTVSLDTSGNLLGGSIPSFISGLTLNGQALSFTLTGFQLGTATVTNIIGGRTGYLFTPTLQGFFTVGQNYAGEGSLAARFIVPDGPNNGLGTTYRGDFIAIASAPTPVLLPGLLAMSANILRKRKSQRQSEASLDQQYI